MNSIRSFVADDVPQVADLHRRVFRTAEWDTRGWEASYNQYFSEVFLEHGTGDRALASLVCEDQSGRIIAFLGVLPRRMVFRGRRILMALCSQFVVEPSFRGQVGLQMVKQCLAGPQDLSMTDEAEHRTGKIWEWCGGSMALLHSMRWIRPLQPMQSLLAALGTQMSPPWTAGLSTPAARIVDPLVTRMFPAPFRVAVPRGSREDLDAAMIPAAFPELVGDRTLRSDYDDQVVQWMLGRASRLNGNGQLRKALVRDEAGHVAGWYVYCGHRGKIGEVLQIAAQGRAVPLVLDHLLHDASQQGVVALSGRLDPPFAWELSERFFLLYRRRFSMWIHSQQPEVVDTILAGDAFLSRLDGEWCVRYR